MDQKSKDNKISLGELMEEYRKKRKESSKEGSDPSLFLRWIKVKFNRNRLLDQEFLFQKGMHDCIQEIIDNNNLSHKCLREYTHTLKILTKKYSKQNTHFTLVVALIILIFSAVIKLLTTISADIAILISAAFFFSLFTLIARIYINETVSIYEELISLIDEYLDSEEKT